jgi:hypothetical protein
MADETKPVEDAKGSKGILGMGSKFPLDAIIIVVVPFLVFVFLFLHVMGFLPPQPLRVKVIVPESQASETESKGNPEEARNPEEAYNPQQASVLGAGVTQPAASKPSEQVAIDAQGQKPEVDQGGNAGQPPQQAISSKDLEAEASGNAGGSGDMENEARLKQMAKVYEQMKPASVAAIMSTMSDSEATEILKRMKARDAAKILALMEPERAARLSRLMTE